MRPHDLDEASTLLTRSPRLALASIVAIAAPGCDRQPPPSGSAGFTLRDSAGIEIVENHAPESPAGRFWTIDPEPVIVLGGDDGLNAAAHDSAHLVWDVRGLARLADGRVALLSKAAHKIFLFEPSGGFSRSIGRKGRGPGDFSNPRHLQCLPGDTLVVWNEWFGPVIHFDTTGTLLKHRVRDLFKILDHGKRLSVGSGFGLHEEADEIPLPDGSFVVSAQLDYNPTGAPLFRPKQAFLRIDSTYAAHSLGSSWEGLETLLPEDGRYEVPAPYNLDTHIATGGHPASIYIADGDKNEIRQFSPDGTLRRIIRRTTDRIPLSVESFREWWQNLFRSQPTPDSLVQRFSRIFERAEPLFEGKDLPAMWGLHVDSQGHLWVRELSSGSGFGPPDQWSVFGPDGRWLGVVSAPAMRFGCRSRGRSFSPCWIGEDLFLGLTRTTLGVEKVEGYRINRNE